MKKIFLTLLVWFVLSGARLPEQGDITLVSSSTTFTSYVSPAKDVCISLTCRKGLLKSKIMPNPKPRHDPRFIAPKPIKHWEV